MLLCPGHRLHADSVKLPDDGRLAETILQNSLPMPDRLKIIIEPEEDHFLGDFEDELVVPRHRGQEGFQRQILGERFFVPR